LAVPLLKKKNSRVQAQEEVVVAEVVHPVVELAVRRIVVPVSSSPLVKEPEREEELSATRMISPPFERVQGLRSP